MTLNPPMTSIELEHLLDEAANAAEKTLTA
jgi:hypothetical protein